MRRRLPVLAAAAAVLALAGCGGSGEPRRLPDAVPAPPQRAELGWVESYGEEGARMTFRVDELEVLEDGWRASIAITNGTAVGYALGERDRSLDRRFGLMLFASGDARELEQRNRAGELPAIREAVGYEPSLPAVLGPGETWAGTISAPGSLAAGLWARVVFGALVPVGDSPEGLPGVLVWITDHAYRLRRS